MTWGHDPRGKPSSDPDDPGAVAADSRAECEEEERSNRILEKWMATAKELQERDRNR